MWCANSIIQSRQGYPTQRLSAIEFNRNTSVRFALILTPSLYSPASLRLKKRRLPRMHKSVGLPNPSKINSNNGLVSLVCIRLKIEQEVALWVELNIVEWVWVAQLTRGSRWIGREPTFLPDENHEGWMNANGQYPSREPKSSRCCRRWVVKSFSNVVKTFLDFTNDETNQSTISYQGGSTQFVPQPARDPEVSTGNGMAKSKQSSSQKVPISWRITKFTIYLHYSDNQKHYFEDAHQQQRAEKEPRDDLVFIL